MSQHKLNDLRSNALAEWLLGLGLGFGYLTSLRLIGPVGIPELLVFGGLLALLFKRPRGGFNCYSSGERILRIYMLLAAFVILPIATLITLMLSNHSGSSPVYILSFIAGIMLSLWISDAIRSGSINMHKLTMIFAFAFLTANMVSIIFDGLDVASGARYTGGAKNPNQLIFYASSLSLLLVAFGRSKAIILLPLVIGLTYMSRSDAYYLSLFAVVIIYVAAKIIVSTSTRAALRWLIFAALIIVVIPVIVLLNGVELMEIWTTADEGGGRVGLALNGIYAAIQSPIIGWGAGSFSGLSGPFEDYEAHNTFIDLATQFGFLLPIFIYFVIIKSSVVAINGGQVLIFSFIIAFAVSGLFHYYGRHFVFWLELGIFMFYAFPMKAKSEKNHSLLSAALVKSGTGRLY